MHLFSSLFQPQIFSPGPLTWAHKRKRGKGDGRRRGGRGKEQGRPSVRPSSDSENVISRTGNSPEKKVKLKLTNGERKVGRERERKREKKISALFASSSSFSDEKGRKEEGCYGASEILFLFSSKKYTGKREGAFLLGICESLGGEGGGICRQLLFHLSLSRNGIIILEAKIEKRYPSPPLLLPFFRKTLI